MSISNNIGHNNALKDTPSRNNLNEILNAYLEWQRTGVIEPTIKINQDPEENLECAEQYWLLSSDELSIERFDYFLYSPELKVLYKKLEDKQLNGEIEIIGGSKLKLRSKINKPKRAEFKDQGIIFKYIEISDVTQYGLISSYIEGTIDELPTRGEYVIHKGDVLLALNNSSRGTVVLVPDEFDGTICTSGFIVIKTSNIEEAYILWYSLRSEYCRSQIYYLAQTASQPELKIDTLNNYFKIPIPKGELQKEALIKTKEFFSHITFLLHANKCKFS